MILPTIWLAICGIRAMRLRIRRHPTCIGYFSPEFGITEVLPQYSGGLGILAGDHLKTASDLESRSSASGCSTGRDTSGNLLNAAGWQQERYPLLDPNSLAVDLCCTMTKAQFGSTSRSRADSVRAGLGGSGRPGAAADAGLRRRAECRLRA